MAKPIVSFNSPAIIFGFIGSIAVVILLLIFTQLGAQAFVDWSLHFYLILFAVSIIAGLIAGQRQKLIDGGVLPFHRALLSVFVAFVIIGFVYNLANYLIYNVFDPNLGEEMKRLLSDRMDETLAQNPGESEETRELVEQFKAKEHELTIFAALTGWLIWIVISFIISLIVAAVIRNEPAN